MSAAGQSGIAFAIRNGPFRASALAAGGNLAPAWRRVVFDWQQLMSGKEISPRVQVGVLIALVVFTALTVGVSFIDLPGRWHLAGGVGIAVIKAMLVALFFMHLLHSAAAIRVVVVVAIFWFVAVLLGLTMTDYAFREAVALAPGH
jgi:cytochrome c oxidase subunit 4